jgi:hypothetical protein
LGRAAIERQTLRGDDHVTLDRLPADFALTPEEAAFIALLLSHMRFARSETESVRARFVSIVARCGYSRGNMIGRHTVEANHQGQAGRG